MLCLPSSGVKPRKAHSFHEESEINHREGRRVNMCRISCKAEDAQTAESHRGVKDWQ